MIQWTNKKVLLMMATTRKNEEIVEDLVCLQEDQLGTHMHPRDIAKELDIRHSSACRIIKTKSIKHFKCLKKVHEWYHKGKKSSGCMSLPEKFEKNPQMIECIFFQDEIDFLLQISINRRIVFKRQKWDVPDKSRSPQTNRQFVTAALTWHVVTKLSLINKKD